MISPVQFRFSCFGALVLLLLSGSAEAQTLAPGKSRFEFPDARGNPSHPIPVWCYRPTQLEADAKVVFVMHGVKRNAKTYRDHWAEYAREHGFLLLVPEFSEGDYPREAYQFGDVRKEDPERWTFAVIEHLFDFVKASESLTAAEYYLYGHSAGAQFVHRYMLFMPQARVAMAVSANAGSYTLPTYGPWENASFPWILDPSVVDEERLKSVFSRKLLVLLGEDDTDAHHPQLTHQAEAEAQGPNRWERGHFFFATAQKEAAARETPLCWKLATVPGVGHSDAGMGKAAVAYIVGDRPGR